MPPKGGERIVVIGASAAGLKAAARARRLLPSAEITVLDERSFISYGACGLPYFLSGDIESLDKLRETSYGLIRDPDFFTDVKGIDVRTGIRAVRVDAEARCVEAVDLAGSNRPIFPFDRLVIATGARPRPLAGMDPGPACSYFHLPEEATALRKGLETGQVGSVVIVGGGYIGVELAGAFGELWGCEVTLIEALDGVLPNLLDLEMSGFVAGHLRRQGITVRTGTPVKGVRTADGGAEVEVIGPEGKPEVLNADRAVVAVGVRPRVSWLQESGLEFGPRGGLLVDAHLCTNLPDIYAAGDCVEVVHRVSGETTLIPLGSLANRQGRVVGDNLAGRQTIFGPVAGAACVKVYDWTVAAAGLSAARALAAGFQVRTMWGTFMDAAHYYPEHKQVHLKLVYEAGTRRLLGLQAFGESGVTQRVDVFTTLLHQEGKLEDLLDLEFAYSPPYNAALDPLYGLGCAALNQEEGGIIGVNPATDLSLEFTDRLLLDVRSPDEITEEFPSPQGAVNIPLQELRRRTDELPRDRALLVVCAMGTRSSEACRWLAASGFGDVIYLAGGVNMRVHA